MKYFFISSGIFPILVAMDYDNFIPSSGSIVSVGINTLIAVSPLYVAFGFYPQKLKYLLPVFALAKLNVFAKWIGKGCPADTAFDASMSIAIGDLSFATVFLIAFYRIYNDTK